jgi:hypothetical protein
VHGRCLRCHCSLRRRILAPEHDQHAHMPSSDSSEHGAADAFLKQVYIGPFQTYIRASCDADDALAEVSTSNPRRRPSRSRLPRHAWCRQGHGRSDLMERVVTRVDVRVLFVTTRPVLIADACNLRIQVRNHWATRVPCREQAALRSYQRIQLLRRAACRVSRPLCIRAFQIPHEMCWLMVPPQHLADCYRNGAAKQGHLRPSKYSKHNGGAGAMRRVASGMQVERV